MFEKIIAQIVLALIGWLEKRIEKGSTAVDSDVDMDRLRVAGSRIDEWLQQNGVSGGRQSTQNGATGQG
jgi:hypothetical protein